eukprot:9090518-Alexandrium_andersonii.AAC.1
MTAPKASHSTCHGEFGGMHRVSAQGPPTWEIRHGRLDRRTVANGSCLMQCDSGSMEARAAEAVYRSDI